MLIGEQYTVLLMEGRTPKRCIGIFKTTDEAHEWAKSDGWTRNQYKVIPFNP